MMPIEIAIQRHNDLVDPYLDVWGWEVAAYLFVGGLVAGVMVFSAVLLKRRGEEPVARTLRWLPFLAPVLITVGMLLLFLDLEYKTHAYRFYLALRPTSPMSWGAWILVVIYPVTVAYGLAQLSESEADRLTRWGPLRVTRLGAALAWVRGWALAREEGLQRASIGLGVALGLYTGILLGTLQARALWSSTMLAPLFLVSGLSTGAAFLMLLPVGASRQHALRRWDAWAIAAELVLIGLFLLDRVNAGATPGLQAARFLGGDLTAVFWGFVILAGLLMPLFFEWIERRRALRPSLATPLLVLLGGLLLRWMLVYAGQTPVS